MARLLPSDRTVRRLIIAAAIVGLLGALVPPLFQNRARPLPVNEEFAVSTDPTDVRVADGTKHYESTRVVRTEKADKDAVARVETKTTTTLDDQPFSTLETRTLLNRESVYPEAGASATEQIALPDNAIRRPDFERDGIQFFFPSETEQRSYPYYDSVAQRSEPADFTGVERLNGVPTYTFRQTIAAQPLNDALSDPIHVSGPAKDYYSPAERKRYAFPADTTVALEPYYRVTRDFWVEPTTGVIVNIDETIDVLLATDEQEMRGLEGAALDDARTNRPLFSADVRWSEDSRTAALDRVAKTVNFVKTLALVGWLGKTAAVVLLAAAAWIFFKRNHE